MLKPIFRTPADFKQRTQRGERVGWLDLVRREAGVEQPGAAAGLLVGERDIAGVVRRQRQRDAAEVGLHRIVDAGHGLEHEVAGIMGARNPCLELVEAADRLVLAAIDRELSRGFRARLRQRNWRSLEARGLLLLVGAGLYGGSRACKEIAGGAAGGGRPGWRTARTLVGRSGFHIRRVDLRIIGHAPGERGKLHRLQEGDQLARIRLVHREVVERHVERDLVVEQHQLPRNPRLLGMLDQRLAPLRLLDLAGAEQQLLEVTIFDDQLRRGLDADAGHAWHVVGGISRQRLYLDHLLGRHAEFLDHLGDTDAAVLHGVVHHDLVGHELHQVLVGRDDGGGRAAFARDPGIGRDQIVGLEAALLEARQVEGAHGVADQRKLRDQVVGRRRPVRLVVGIELVAEGDFGLVEHDRQMRRPVVRGHVAQQLPQHVAEAEHGVDLEPVGFAVQRRQRVVGAEDVGGTVDQKDVGALG